MVAHRGSSRQGVSEEQTPLLFLSPRLARGELPASSSFSPSFLPASSCTVRAWKVLTGWRWNEGLNSSAASDRSQLVGPRVRRGLKGYGKREGVCVYPVLGSSKWCLQRSVTLQRHLWATELRAAGLFGSSDYWLNVEGKRLAGIYSVKVTWL